MKRTVFMSYALCALLLLSACGGGAASQAGGGTKTTPAVQETAEAKSESVTNAAKETKEKASAEAVKTDSVTEAAPEDASVEDVAAEEDGWSDDSEPEVPELTKDQFYEYFDMVLQDSDADKDAFFVEYGDRKYFYKDLGDLYDAAKKEGGTIDVKIMGDEEEEMLDLEIIANQLAFLSDWDQDVWIDTAPSQELIDRFYGDWHGVVAFENCTGKYETSLGGDWVTSIARIYIDPDGYVIPFLGLHVQETPIEDLTAELDAEDECLYLSGSWISVPFEHIPMTEKNGTLHCEIPLSKEAGSVTLVFNLRHLNDINWAGEDPALPEDYIVNCQGWSFDKLAESNGYTSWDYVQYSEGEEPEYPVQIAPEKEKEDFGKTTEEADGFVSSGQLLKGYRWIMDEMDRSGHDPITYEKIRDQFGVDGVKSSPAQWSGTTHVYEWRTSDEKEWVSIRFTVNGDGSETLNTVNQSDGVLKAR